MSNHEKVDSDIEELTMPSPRQLTINRYFSGILIDLAVLNLFAEYWERVELDSFTVSLFAAVLLQISLKATLKLEHSATVRFKGKPGFAARIKRMLTTWAIVFGAKLVLLYVIGFIFGDSLQFHGPNHGLLAFLVVVISMLAIEDLVFRLFRAAR